MNRFLYAAFLMIPTAMPAQNTQAPPCSTPEYRQFDFWIGTWDVFNPNGVQVGTNTIRSIYDGCALEERWRSSGTSAGGSFNIYDAAHKKWHQTWVDNGGLLLELDGAFAGGKMVLQGTRMRPDGVEIVNRITWQELEPGKVRQHWETSDDGGETWSTAFDGTYVRRSGDPQGRPSSVTALQP